jgi:hypothetical protein
MVDGVVNEESLNGHRTGGLRWFPEPSKHRRHVVGLLVWQVCALAGQVAAVALARQDQRLVGELLSDLSLAAAYSSALWVLTSSYLDRATRNTAVVCLGLTPTLMWRATNPLLFTGFDEQLHMRTLGDIFSSHRLFQANPLLEVSPRYPGLEAVATLLHQCGIPTMAAAFLVVIASRLVLVTVLCDATEQMTGSARAGGLAVAVYAFSSQFVFFNSQFAYQTMALPLALAAVSFIARARGSDNPVPLLGGATVCLLAVAVTHHVTSFITAGFLALWAAAEFGRGRMWAAYGACAALAATLTWAIIQRQLLSDYFSPIIDDVRAQFVGGERRELFKDSAGTAARSLDQYLLLYYAAALSLMVLVVVVLAHRERHLRWGPLLILGLMSGAIPVFLAARVLPKGGELYDRSNSFLFIPLSMYVASFAAWFWWREPHQYGFRQHRRVKTVRVVGIALAAGAFIGGYVLGSGPNWARLPGPHMVAADTRSMDSEVLAAAQWARTGLPAGSRIAADRIGSDLLAAQAGVWPVMKGPGGIDAPALYVARKWSQTETDMAIAMRLRYLYVDRRMADELPHFGSYFYQGETGNGVQYTVEQLTKFEKVPGIALVYRHGPISIYDIKGLGVPELRSGWFKPTPQVRVTTQLAVGMLCGLLFAGLMRTRFWPRIADDGKSLLRAWGPALTGATLLASACLVSILLLLSGVWLTPLTIWSGLFVVVVTNPERALSVVRRWRISKRNLRIAVMLMVPLGIIVAASVRDAATEDIIGVHRILTDPNAVHVPASGPER